MGTNLQTNPTIQAVLTNNTKIATVVNRSCDNIQRILITFHNGHTLSVIRGSGTHGGSEGLFEIMPSEITVFKPEQRGDTVLGHLTPEDVCYYIAKLGDLPEVLSSSTKRNSK